MAKMAIREIEEELPTISESIKKMDSIERLLLRMMYHQVRKHIMFNRSVHIRILDIGCGDGLFLQRISDVIRKSNCEYVGIDISLRKLRFARTRFQKLGLFGKTHCILADAEYLPFRASVFKVATIIEVLEHLLDPNAHISELARVITRTGKVIITTPSAYGIKRGIISTLKRFLCPLKQDVVSHRETCITIEGRRLPHRDFTLSEITGLLSIDFAIIKIYSFNFRILYHVMKRILPYKVLVWVIWRLENSAPKFPHSWGSNWLILCKKRCR
ncbi:MAG: class I SAM-dependent methyltransferase [Candidatus Baldrarchaeia archaeon]